MSDSRKLQSAPKSWPPLARKLYKPVRRLGTGGFGAVWLAKVEAREEAGEDEKEISPEYVAIKLVGHPLTSPVSNFEKMSEEGYFRREVEVLQELSHPRVVKLLQKIEVETVKNSKEASPYCMALEYCRGPTLDQMLAHGGGLGLPMAREISAQLIDAVSYLHGRGVIHRDIKVSIAISCKQCMDTTHFLKISSFIITDKS